MKSLEIKTLAKSLKYEGKSYTEIGQILKCTKDSARNLCRSTKSNNTHKRGPKKKITKAYQLRIKRAISNIQERQEKVNAPKIIRHCELPVSVSTVQRYMTSALYNYKKAKRQIVLTRQQKQKRIEIISSWITNVHPWEITIFSDEKKFSLDGNDNWKSYVRVKENIIRNKRVCRGGSLMVWLMTLPNGLLSFLIYRGTFNSEKYKQLLMEMIVPIIKLNLGNNFFLQEDNSRVHKSRTIRNFMELSKINILEWPPYSPDLNIVEDVWKMISDMVYDRSQYTNLNELEQSIVDCIAIINKERRQDIVNLYASIRNKLCKVLLKGGDLYNTKI